MRKLITALVIISMMLVITSTALAISSDIKANSSDGPVNIQQANNLSIAISLDPESSAAYSDWWLAAATPFGWYYFDASTMSWAYAGGSHTDLSPTYQRPLFIMSTFEVLNMSGLPEGTYTFYFAVDTNMNDSLDFDQLYYDSVVVVIDNLDVEDLVFAEIADIDASMITVVTDKHFKEAIGVFAEKDAGGNPTRVTGAVYVSESGEIGGIELGTDGLPTSITDNSTGNSAVFRNYTNSTVDISVYDSDEKLIEGPHTANIDSDELVKIKELFGSISYSIKSEKDLLSESDIDCGDHQLIRSTLKSIGTALGLASCVSIPFGGVTMPVAVLSCASTLRSVLTSPEFNSGDAISSMLLNGTGCGFGGGCISLVTDMMETFLEITEITFTNEFPTGIINNKRPHISVDIKASNCANIDEKSIIMKLDGSPVSRKVFGEVQDVHISYTPEGDLIPGVHKVEVYVETENGFAKENKTWEFRIPVSGGDMCGGFNFRVKYPIPPGCSSESCSFHLSGSFAKICATVEYPDENTIIVTDTRTQLINIGVYKVLLTLGINLSFSIERFPTNMTCMVNPTFYVPSLNGVSGEIYLSFTQNGKTDCLDCNFSDGLDNLNISDGNGLFPAPTSALLTINCSTGKLERLELFFDNTDYPTPAGGMLDLLDFYLLDEYLP